MNTIDARIERVAHALMLDLGNKRLVLILERLLAKVNR